MDGGFPLRLQFREHFFTQVTAFAPTLGELVQLTGDAFPVGALGMLSSPSFEFFDQSHTLGFVGCSLGTGLFEPGIDHHMGFVTSRIKSLPQSGIGRSLFVDFFPLLTQIAQCLLHLAAAHGGNKLDFFCRFNRQVLSCRTRRFIVFRRRFFFCFSRGRLEKCLSLHSEFKPLLVYQDLVTHRFDFAGGFASYASSGCSWGVLRGLNWLSLGLRL